MSIQKVRIQGNGTFRRAGRVWPTTPIIAAVYDHDTKEDGPLPSRPPTPPGCGAVVTSEELERIIAEAERGGASYPLRVDRLDEVDKKLHEHAVMLATADEEIEGKRQQLDELRIEQESLEKVMEAHRAALEQAERSLAEKTDQAQRAEAAAHAAEERVRQLEARQQALDEQQRSTRGKR